MDKKKKTGVRLSSFATNEEKESEGVWVDYESGLRVKVGRLGNKACEIFLLNRGRAGARTLKKIQSGKVDPEEAKTLMKDMIAECCMFGWEGLLNDKDEPIPFSKAKAREALEHKDFFAEILDACQDRALFIDENKEAAAKN